MSTPTTATSLVDGQDRDVLRAQLLELESRGHNVSSAGWGPDGATAVHRAFLDFDERGQTLLRRAYADRRVLTRFQTTMGQALRFTPPAPEAMTRTVLMDVEDKTEQLRQLVADLDNARDAITDAASPLDPTSSSAVAADSATDSPETPAAPTASTTSAHLYVPTGTEIFLVHGRDDGAKETVARFLDKATPGPVTILHEQPHAGATIIEKLERHSQVAFAVVLLTGDDVVTLADSSTPGTTASDAAGGAAGTAASGTVEHRARQNVIAELGWFTGKLGRARVCALYQPGVVLPSDWNGVGYVPYTGRDWRSELLREIQAAGIKVDWSAVA